MKYLKKFENNDSDILQKYHIEFMNLEKNIESIQSEIKKLQSSIYKQENEHKELARKCVDEFFSQYGFKYTNYDAGYHYENNEGFHITVDFVFTQHLGRAFITLYTNDFKDLTQEVWTIHSSNTHKLKTILENIEKTILEYQSKKFNL